MKYETVIGLEVHAEMQTHSKMFCGCPVVDSTQTRPNVAVCPVCAGMPGVLPVVNRQAVEYALRVALALECSVAQTSLFARKNYFYPDLPKGYQISQYEDPLAEHGRLVIDTSAGERLIRITRVHLEEDAGKLTHVEKDGQSYSLVDLNRAGVALLEIVSEPDMRSAEEARAYAEGLRSILRALGVNSGDMEKGVIRFEANISLRPAGSPQLGTRVEVKNLNSFRALERSIAYEVERQAALLDSGAKVDQETLGWDEPNNRTYSQRSKEEAHDYRYFPEPDLPPLVVETEWVDRVRAGLPELPRVRTQRFIREYDLPASDAAVLAAEADVANYFEALVRDARGIAPRLAANFILGEVFAWQKTSGERIDELKVRPAMLADLLERVTQGEITLLTTKTVLAEMLASGRQAADVIGARGLTQISDGVEITRLVAEVIAANPGEMEKYLAGKESVANWFFGQVMRLAGKRANPAMLRAELNRQLAQKRPA
ncbi:aspartyl/glutamyl-tRNA(Asn/Gln) amidotransferase subunit B [Longilinea arvoryzae]|uniref:Aspartyl/glutamyl-tRNA(Asn/Gln) amidotransferase subunit B n=1 Tax=Longilinea arvoryzae TaxID=360412 RepID=A0A0S7BEF2_9CHLR|nr:Asp-tRNA(Asn)/Glu-tRNA(Gln) amidotransferase subunit GatB [Longilinea arvoryzae]GAP12408.1 aspartyl/glutamyl-tRNA(Asn/Gln) amidotransferase subunit B [Longilinea arvoryzae]